MLGQIPGFAAVKEPRKSLYPSSVKLLGQAPLKGLIAGRETSR